ncbi:multiheme c-type cytochrome [Rhodopirellula sp. P2]|uniref:multiheme c-type cytochrome n=1 Tax=Rhodopirellula sp. P2 TaxID=2127060 RepID=UPI0023681597|nr:multiheme c-type cytochrome [Rhodopirellula sp. P2]WDQ18509.1 multiheme c-type cytochrome [Rhodopirellula sp. P2]
MFSKILSAKSLQFLGLLVLLVTGVCAASVARDLMSIAPAPSSAARRTLAPQDSAASISKAVTQWSQFVSSQFAGDQACQACHPAEYEAHLRSGHSRTATPMVESELAQQLLQQGHYNDPLRNQTFRFTKNANQFLVSTSTGQGRAVTKPFSDPSATGSTVSVAVNWLLGSGTHAQTPIAIQHDGSRGIEMRWSSFHGDDQLNVTPDHDQYDTFRDGTAECLGRPMDAMDVRSCIGCHSTVVPPPPLPLTSQTMIANVGCERCHGPRKQHVILAGRGLPEQSKPMIDQHDASAHMETCSACHRDERSVSADSTAAERARFQPYGLKKSECYLQSAGELTCSTCHDPHDTTSHDRQQYIQQCQTCHQPQASTICPEAPSGDCIECHMPLTPWTPGIAFRDHWIRIVGDTASHAAETTREASP